MRHPPLAVRFSGPLACFTRPEMKVERVSYQMMTPSAARGALEAILWKPEFRWVIREIHVLRPIAHHSFVRNEVNHKLNPASAIRSPYFADDTAGNRAQRHTLALRDVAYLVKAEIRLSPEAKDPIMKYREMFDRRVARGQCFHRPYLGCREFAAEFEAPRLGEHAEQITMDLGTMLLDIDFTERPRPLFFQARLVDGILVPPVPPKFQEAGAC